MSKSWVQMQLSFVLYSVPVCVCFLSNKSITEKQANTRMGRWERPKEKKAFLYWICFIRTWAEDKIVFGYQNI